jgi:hypothetical protein
MLPTRSQSDRRGALGLLAACLVIAGVWFVVLPALGRTRAVREHIERNDRNGIDPSAKFYTELPGMPLILERIDSVHRRDGAAFWTLPPKRDAGQP